MTPPGRPRSAEADRAILDAALQLLYEHGYNGMSMEAVAEAAGVGKTTVYRRYPSKDDLITAAIVSLKGGMKMPDSGDTRADLVELLRQVVRSKERIQSMRLMGTLWVAREQNPELLELFRDRVIKPRRQMMLEVLTRGQARGQVRGGIDPVLVTEMLVGAHFARQFNGIAFPRDWPVRVTVQLSPSVSGVPVALFERSGKSQTWSLARRANTTAGKLTVDVKVRATTRFVAQWPGDADRNGDGSPITTVTVGKKKK